MGRGKLAIAVLAFLATPGAAQAMAPLYDPVTLNIGINCQWQRSCQRRQMDAMKAAHDYIAETRPPVWRIHRCNRNAARGVSRMDWVGFNACIRNGSLRPLPRPKSR
jgi:hypothetical protein